MTRQTKLFYATLTTMCLFGTSLFAQNKTGGIKGTITSKDGKSLQGVLIQLTNNHQKALSKHDGSFYLKNLRPGSDTIIISFVGAKLIKLPIEVQKGEIVKKDFLLKETAYQLKEIKVHSGYSVYGKATSIGKMAIQPMDLPQATMVIPGELIQNQQAQKLSDIVKNVNGVYLGAARASTQETFYARGYNFSSTNLFKNGTRVYRGVMPEVSSLEKVEVLKGGAAVLFGNVAPGGILNMITKKPKFQFGGEVNLRAGSAGLIKPGFDVYGPISSSVAYRLIGTYEQANSFRDNVSSKKYYINPSLLFKLGKKTNLLLEGDYLNSDFTPDFGIGSLNSTQIADVPRSRFMGASWQYNKIAQTTTSARLTHEFNDKWKFNATASYQSVTRDYYAVERIQADATGKWARPLGKVDMEEKTWSAQANLLGTFNTGKVKHFLLTGVDAQHYNTGSYRFDIQGDIYDTINILNPNAYTQRTDMPAANRVSHAKSAINRVGVYAQDLISISEKFKVLAGIGWSIQQSPESKTTYLANDSLARGASQSNNAFSPKLGLVYKILPTMSLFGTYSNSYSINSGTDIYANALPPSIIDQYEAGIKNIFFEGRFTANVTVYSIINNNLAQTAEFDKDGKPNNNSKIKELSGQTTSKGVEIDLATSPIKGMNIIAGYSYNDMRYTKTPNTPGSYVEGERLVTTPQNTANATIFYTFQQGALKGIKLGASAFYTGKRFGGWNDRQGQSQAESRMIPVPDFTTIDISAGYRFKKISLLAKISNLTNTYNYYVHENYSINPIAPRQIIGTISYRF